MKKISFLPILALVLGIAASAFTTTTHVSSSSNQSDMYWYIDPADGQTFQGVNTKAGEEAATLCDSNGEICEKGYDVTQLVDPQDPLQGVKESERNNFVSIHRR